MPRNIPTISRLLREIRGVEGPSSALIYRSVCRKFRRASTIAPLVNAFDARFPLIRT